MLFTKKQLEILKSAPLNLTPEEIEQLKPLIALLVDIELTHKEDEHQRCNVHQSIHRRAS